MPSTRLHSFPPSHLTLLSPWGITQYMCLADTQVNCQNCPVVPVTCHLLSLLFAVLMKIFPSPNTAQTARLPSARKILVFFFQWSQHLWMPNINGQPQKNWSTVHIQTLVRQGVNASKEGDCLTPLITSLMYRWDGLIFSQASLTYSKKASFIPYSWSQISIYRESPENVYTLWVIINSDVLNLNRKKHQLS